MTFVSRVRYSLLGLANAALLASSVTAGAASPSDSYPSQPIRLVVPYAAGGTTDLIGRRFAEQLGGELGQTVIVENRPGGSTNIGAEYVVRAKPDGYTLLMGNNGQVMNPVLGPTPSFELSALEPISLMSHVAFVLAANPKAPFNTGAEFLSAAKSSPGKLTVSSAQLDSYVELLNRKADIKLLHIPYKGGAPATTDAISGQVDMVFALLPVLQPHLQAGKLKPLAVTSRKRLPALPDTPTFTELGANYDIVIWYGLMAPAGTPKAIVDRLAMATQKIMSKPEMVAQVRAAGAEPAWSTPEQFQAQLRDESAFWQQVARDIPQLVQK